MNREQLYQRVQGNERAANTEQRAALQEFARVEERAANNGRRSEWRTALPESMRDEESAANSGNS